MLNVSIDEIQQDFLGYLRRVSAGEAFVILQAERPIAEIKPIDDTPTLSEETHKIRPVGLCAGEFIVPDDFDEPLPDDVLKV